jgi:uncharacterized protein YeaO (DUF488 family)
MELEEYSQQRNKAYIMRVLNKRYWPHHVTVNDTKAAERWCYDNIPGKRWRNVDSYFAFKYSEDAVMFSLRWA